MSELQDKFEARSINTVRTAQQRLVEDGLLEARHGLGVFVRRRPRDEADPDRPVRRLGHAEIDDFGPDRTVTVRLRLGPRPGEWGSDFGFAGKLRRQWPTLRIQRRAADHMDYVFTIDEKDLEDVVAEFDCLVAEANADYLGTTRPLELELERGFEAITGRINTATDPRLYRDFVYARAEASVCDRDDRLIDAALQAQARATLLRSLRDKSHALKGRA